MCNVDNGVLGQVWVGGDNGSHSAFPDFSTLHICKNYDDIRAYAESVQVGDFARCLVSSTYTGSTRGCSTGRLYEGAEAWRHSP